MNKRSADKIIRSVFRHSNHKFYTVFVNNPSSIDGNPVLAGLNYIEGLTVLIVAKDSLSFKKGLFRKIIEHEKAHLDTGLKDLDPNFDKYCAARKIPYWKKC